MKNGKIVVGRKAKNNQEKCPQDTVVEVKRLMGKLDGKDGKEGKPLKISLGQATFSPQEISAMYLKEIKRLAEEELGEPVTGAVITCPAYFKDPQRNATKEAGQIAGLNVLNIINEPTAAAYAYGVAQQANDNENLFLVYDLGGGTFDVTVISMISGQLEVIGTGGDPNLGGGDFDDRIVDWMLGKIKKNIPEYLDSLDEVKLKILKIRLKSYAEEGKIALCGPPLTQYEFKLAAIDRFQGKPVPFNEVLTMEVFESIITDLVENSLKWIDVAMQVPKSEKYNYTEENITEVLLVGGSTRVPMVRKRLAERFPNKPLRGTENGINPDEIVAMGAGILASELDPDTDEVTVNSLVDVTGHTLSVETMGPDNKAYLSPIIPKETPIPTEAAHQFQSMGQGTAQVRIKVYQGEDKDPNSKEVTMIGEYLMDIDPIQEPTPLLIGLNIDKNGILVAFARNLINGNQIKCQINYSDSAKMSPEELKRKQDELEAKMAKDIGTTVNPLEESSDTRQASNYAGNSTTAKNFQTQQGSTNADTADTVSQQMNPIVRNLYEKAINNFGSVPKENQYRVMQIIGEMEQAARMGDQGKLMELYAPLSQLVGSIK
jgi:molecular chaperone DnaK